MNTIRQIALFATLLIVITGYVPKAGNAIVEGVVVSEQGGKPVSRVHVYIVHGEEEALTNSKGGFRIETSKKFPVILFADHEKFEKYEASISGPGRYVVKLKSK